MAEGHPYYDARTAKLVSLIGAAGWLFAILSLILSGVLLAAHLGAAPAPVLTSYLKVATLILAVGWAVIPPIWFSLEYWWFYDPREPHPEGAFEHFKLNQQYATAQWAGVLFVVGLTLSTVL